MAMELPEGGSLADAPQNLLPTDNPCPTDNVDSVVKKEGCQGRGWPGQDHETLPGQREEFFDRVVYETGSCCGISSRWRRNIMLPVILHILPLSRFLRSSESKELNSRISKVLRFTLLGLH